MLLQIQLPESYLPVLKHLSDTYGSRTAGIKALLDAITHGGVPPQSDPDAGRKYRESEIAASLVRMWYARCWRDADEAFPSEAEAEWRQQGNEKQADALLVSEYRAAQYSRRLSVPTMRELRRDKHPQETAADTVLLTLIALAPAAEPYSNRDYGAHVAGCYRPRPHMPTPPALAKPSA